jgi:parvulin-like peptidyl-prolyl isomerase
MRTLSCALLAALVVGAVMAAEPALKVNGIEISSAELALAQRMGAAAAQGAKPGDPALLRYAVDQVVNRLMLVQVARAAGVTVDAQEVTASMAEQAKQAGGPEAFAKAIAQTGLAEADIRRLEENRLITQRYIERQVAPKTVVADDEVRAYYDAHAEEFKHPEQNKLRLVVVHLDPVSDEAKKAAAKTRADQARDRIAKGEEFAKVASEVSDGPNKSRGGDLGWIQKGKIPIPELENAIAALKVGEVTPVVATDKGFFIFKLDAKRGAGVSPFDEVKDTLRNMLRSRKLEETLYTQIFKQRAQAKIETSDPAIKAALAPLPESTTGTAGSAKPVGSGTVPAHPTSGSQPTPTAKPSGDAPKRP